MINIQWHQHKWSSDMTPYFLQVIYIKMNPIQTICQVLTNPHFRLTYSILRVNFNIIEHMCERNSLLVWHWWKSSNYWSRSLSDALCDLWNGSIRTVSKAGVNSSPRLGNDRQHMASCHRGSRPQTTFVHFTNRNQDRRRLSNEVCHMAFNALGPLSWY